MYYAVERVLEWWGIFEENQGFEMGPRETNWPEITSNKLVTKNVYSGEAASPLYTFFAGNTKETQRNVMLCSMIDM